MMIRSAVQPQTGPAGQPPKDVSVIVPFYNTERYIGQCIEALLAQDYPSASYEIIMVDNNSTDRSAELVRQHPRIRLLAEPKQGSYAARNRGVAASNGAILAFTDSDCVPAADWLQHLTSAIRSPGVELVLGGRSFAVDSPTLSMLAAWEAERTACLFSVPSTNRSTGYTNNMGIRRDLFDRLGPFLEIPRGADSVFVHQVVVAYSTQVVRYAPEAHIRHLEITGVDKWLLKKFIYGRSAYRNRSLRQGRGWLTGAETRQIIESIAQRRRHPELQERWLRILLRMGQWSNTLGRRSAELGGGMEPAALATREA